MEENRRQPLHPRDPQPSPRRFVYRSVEPAPLPHPHRRTTDTPNASHAPSGQLRPRPLLLEFRAGRVQPPWTSLPLNPSLRS